MHFDKRRLVKGQHFWEQIGQEISNPELCDAWAFVVTPDSLASPPCMEELEYALTRALDRKTQGFPVIPLVYKVEPRQLPPALKCRLAVLLRDPDWVEQVVAAVRGEPAPYPLPDLGDWKLCVHPGRDDDPNVVFVLEIQPRVRSLSPFGVAVPAAERDRVCSMYPCPAGQPWASGPFSVIYDGERLFDRGTSHEVLVYTRGFSNVIDYAHSVFLFLKRLPSRVWVGDPSSCSEIDLSSLRSRVP